MAKLLEGLTAIVACSRMKAAHLVSGLEGLGARVLPFEAIEVRAVEDQVPLDGAINRLDDYAWVVFTSTHAVVFFARALTGSGRAGLPAALRVCAVGPATAAKARAEGFRVDLVPERFVGDAAALALASAVRPGSRVLFPRARVARDVIPEALKSAGAIVEVIPVYETLTGSPDASNLNLDARPDLLVFTSSSTVSAFVSVLGEEAAREMMTQCIVAAIGPVTAATAAALGKKAEIVPASHTIPGLLDSIGIYFARKREKP
jgi:uroporphyrinogen-III synthase